VSWTSIHANTAAAGVFGRHGNPQLPQVYLYHCVTQSVTVGHMIADHLLTSLFIVIFKVHCHTLFMTVGWQHIVRIFPFCLPEPEGVKTSNHFDGDLKLNTFAHADIIIWPQDCICLSRLNLYRQDFLIDYTHTHTHTQRHTRAQGE